MNRRKTQMAELTYNEIHEDVLRPLKPAKPIYYVIVAILALGVAWFLTCWCFQNRVGLRVTGLHVPVCWAFYITNFVFWVGIGHAGTLISAILHLVRSHWRTAVSRSSEAMTVFAVMTAALFPLVHLGRVWVFYYILPYPSERQIWPNFVSPLVWDVCAVGTYLTVSTIFWLVGLIPDTGASRDLYKQTHGPRNLRTRVYGIMSLGWTGSSTQWHHYGRAYLFFAALATPLVISVHSVVSWDFAMANLPGWHTTIFAPYFVAGAIHSGLAMVLVLLIPMRRLFNLERLITIDHFEAVAKTMLVTALIVGYAYVIEPFIARYSHDIYEGQFSIYRATGWFAFFYWSLSFCNVLVPLVFLFRAARRNLKTLFIVGIFVNIGMWVERWVIIAGSLSHDFMPHNWSEYAPTWVEISITAGALCFFLLWFFLFSKHLPTIAISDVKELAAGLLYKPEPEQYIPKKEEFAVPRKVAGLTVVFKSPDGLIEAVRKLRENGFRQIETFSPFRLDEVNSQLHPQKSPVRIWTLIGAICGCIGGFWLAIGSAYVNGLYVGGKFGPAAYIPYCIVGFEGLILIGSLSNLAAMIYYTRLGRIKLPAAYDPSFIRDRFGLFAACPHEQIPHAKTLLSPLNPEQINVV
jgi:Ni/Fe-hydrogenase subunit HybB-like protein